MRGAVSSSEGFDRSQARWSNNGSSPPHGEWGSLVGLPKGEEAGSWGRSSSSAGGVIKQVIVDVSGEPYADLEKEAIGAFARE